jgi:hypothetical protein
LCDAEHSIMCDTAPKGFLEAFQSVSTRSHLDRPDAKLATGDAAAISQTASAVRLQLRETTIHSVKLGHVFLLARVRCSQAPPI